MRLSLVFSTTAFFIFLLIDCIHFAQSDPASSPEVSDLGEWKNVKNARNVRNADSIAHPNLPWY